RDRPETRDRRGSTCALKKQFRRHPSIPRPLSEFRRYNPCMEIVQTGHPVLRAVGKTLDANELTQLPKLIEEMKGTMREAPGVGLDALDENGRTLSIDATGWYARILQHEIDHLHGRLYIDRMRTRSFCTQDHYTQHWRAMSTAEVVAWLETNTEAR